MRFAWLMAALAALWAMPAEAVTTITLKSPTSSQGVHQKITLTGLTDSDLVDVAGYSGTFTFGGWIWLGDQWYYDANDGFSLDCTTLKTGQCHDEIFVKSTGYPISLFATLDIKVVANEIFVDWSKSDDVTLCRNLAEADRVSLARCDYMWRQPNAMILDINVTGPSASSFGYSVETLSSPVPEPSSWALMIVGIGLIGAAVRRRPVLRPVAFKR